MAQMGEFTQPFPAEMPNQSLIMQGMADPGPKTRAGTLPRHPVEKLLLTSYRRNEHQEMMTKALTYGQHAPIRAKMEREILSSFQRLPGLPSSLVGLETVMDMDDEIEFEDIFNLEQNAPVSRTTGPNFGVHEVMEARLGMRF
mmetsp:Transcript_132533/g.247867  ORF Transcript_132533/g.247867 Transcript_132533/m.247867 type:complete len:143 (+) Transcript_132533:100-528(+)